MTLLLLPLPLLLLLLFCLLFVHLNGQHIQVEKKTEEKWISKQNQNTDKKSTQLLNYRSRTHWCCIFYCPISKLSHNLQHPSEKKQNKTKHSNNEQYMVQNINRKSQFTIEQGEKRESAREENAQTE